MRTNEIPTKQEYSSKKWLYSHYTALDDAESIDFHIL